ncbi:MAG: sigma-70 family RNA polymerase sigma factor [Actinomycetota bacterium]
MPTDQAVRQPRTIPQPGWRQSHRLLTAVEERELAQRIEAGRDAQARVDDGCGRPGDDDVIGGAHRARHEFMECNVRLVQSVANGFHLPGHVDREDAVQDGMLGLERAVDRFDWRRGYKFSTYATWWIRQAIQRGLETTSSTIRIPAQRARELRSAHASAIATPEQGRRPLSAALATIDQLTTTDSIDRLVGDAPLGSMLSGDIEPPEERAMRTVTDQAVRRLVDDLDPPTRYAVRARFGLDDDVPATYGQIGLELGVTAQAARRRVERALGRMREDAARFVA